MPQPRYLLADAVLPAILILPDREWRHLLAAFDQIAANPRDSSTCIDRDWDGRLVSVVSFGRFEIGYLISPETGAVTITLVRPRRPSL